MRTATTRSFNKTNSKTVQNPKTKSFQNQRGRIYGSGNRKVVKKSIVLGVCSIGSFCLFWVVLLIAMNVVMTSLMNSNVRGLMGAGVIGLLAFIFPILGLTIGIIGAASKHAEKITAYIGAILNGLLLLFILVNMLSKHT
jgi:hypothetical protein